MDVFPHSLRVQYSGRSKLDGVYAQLPDEGRSTPVYRMENAENPMYLYWWGKKKWKLGLELDSSKCFASMKGGMFDLLDHSRTWVIYDKHTRDYKKAPKKMRVMGSDASVTQPAKRHAESDVVPVLNKHPRASSVGSSTSVKAQAIETRPTGGDFQLTGNNFETWLRKGLSEVRDPKAQQAKLDIVKQRMEKISRGSGIKQSTIQEILAKCQMEYGTDQTNHCPVGVPCPSMSRTPPSSRSPSPQRNEVMTPQKVAKPSQLV